MTNHSIVSSDEWVAARKELLQKEKEFSRLREELTQQRRNLPWERVEKQYTFDGPHGELSLGDLFAGRSQLIVYHFMFGPDWEEGCKACSLLADHYDSILIHLQQRDVSLVTVSRAPLAKLEAYKQRMNWSFPWVSSASNDFNWDYQVSFRQEDVDAGKVNYNYQEGVTFPSTEAPGMSTFCKDDDGAIYHTYSAFARGLENFLGVYNFLDIVPKGRDEDDLPYTMAWIRHKDRYAESSVVDLEA